MREFFRRARILFTDRGPGFYHRRWGTVTGDYESACREHGFKLWAGTNSKKGPRAQPPDLADFLLHETVVPWLRSREERARPTRPWQETPHELEARLQQAADWANTWFDGRSLCMGVPKRLSAMVSETHGDRLPH